MHSQFSLAARLPYHSLLMFMAIMAITLMLPGLLLLGTHQQASAQVVEWSDAERLTSSAVDSLGPDITIDSLGVSHVVYVETDFGDKGDVYYTHNRAGSWSTPVRLSENTRTEAGGGNKAVSISTATVGGVVYLGVAYQGRISGGDNEGRRRIFYRGSADGGLTWTEPEEATTTSAIHPSLLLDDLGQPHMGFIKAGDEELRARYTTRLPTGWSEFEDLSNDEDKNSSIAYVRDAAGLWIYYFFQTRPNGGGQSDMRVVSRVRSPDGTWSDLVEHDSDIAQHPKIVSDGVASVYAVWSAKEEDVDIEPFFSRSDNNSNVWSSAELIGTNSSDLGQRPAIARSPATGALAVVWEDDYEADEFKYDIFGRMSFDNGATWSNLQFVFQAPGGAGSANIGANPTGGFRSVWDDGVDGKLRILTSGYNDPVTPGAEPPTPLPTETITVTPVPTDTVTITPLPTDTVTITPLPGETPAGTIQVSPLIAASPNVSVTISASGADQYQLSNDGVTFSDLAPIPPGGMVSWSLPDVPPTSNACINQPVYARLQNSTTAVASDVIATSVQRDLGVDVTVDLRNPYLASNEPLLLRSTMVQDYGGGGASDGDPGFTRNDFYLLNVTANAGECSGLQQIDPGVAVFPTNEGELGTTNQAVIAFDGFELVDGVQEVTIQITDKAGNVTEVMQSIVLDTIPPTLEGTVAALTAAPATIDEETPIVNLTFSGMVVTDTYRHSQNPNQPYWGVWLANSARDIPLNDTATLDTLVWQPVEVVSTDPTSFSIENWNLTTELWEAPTGNVGYYVYARVLDGAGNSSITTLRSNQVLVNPARGPGSPGEPVSGGTLYLPLLAH